jgi:23S rRNA G2069 N7-methylase RlmK/C1962 C5-methylase RlmI
MPPERLESQIAAAFEDEGRKARILATGGLPADYPTPADKPSARYLKVFVLQAL